MFQFLTLPGSGEKREEASVGVVCVSVRIRTGCILSNSKECDHMLGLWSYYVRADDQAYSVVEVRGKFLKFSFAIDPEIKFL